MAKNESGTEVEPAPDGPVLSWREQAVTVQEVVERSGQSLRSFYQYFGGKHELLLALFQETVRTTTEALRAELDSETDAFGRLHRFVVEYYQLCRPAPPGRAAKEGQGPPLM